MKRYKFEIEIFEGNDEFWDSIAHTPGCCQVQLCVEEALKSNGFVVGDDCKVVLTSFSDDQR